MTFFLIEKSNYSLSKSIICIRVKGHFIVKSTVRRIVIKNEVECTIFEIGFVELNHVTCETYVFSFQKYYVFT